LPLPTVRRVADAPLGLLTAERMGTDVPVRILRGGVVRELSVVVGERR